MENSKDSEGTTLLNISTKKRKTTRTPAKNCEGKRKLNLKKEDKSITSKNETLADIPLLQTEGNACTSFSSDLNPGTSSDWQKVSSPIDSIGFRKDISIEISTVIPEMNLLLPDYLVNYKNRVLNKLFDSTQLVDDPFGFFDLNNQSQNVFNSYSSANDFVTRRRCAEGILLLKTGCGEESKKIMLSIANEFSYVMRSTAYTLPRSESRAFHCFSMFVYALTIFKQVVQFQDISKEENTKLPSKKEIKTALRYMKDLEETFYPFPSFILGILQLYKVENIYEIIKRDPSINPLSDLGLWYTTEINVMNQSEDDTMSRAQHQYELLNLARWQRYDTIITDKSSKLLKWIHQTVEYELALRIILGQEENLYMAKKLLEELSNGDFVEACYFYAFSLLTNVFGDTKLVKKYNFDKAYQLLNKAVSNGHQEAMLLLGTLPFRKDFEFLDEEIQKHSFDHLCEYLSFQENVNFKKEVASLVAAEYLKINSIHVTYDVEIAKEMLRVNGCFDELCELENKLQEYSAFPEVLKAIDQVHNLFKKSGERYSQLSLVIEKLIKALKSSDISIKRSYILSLILKSLFIDITDLQPHLAVCPLSSLYKVLVDEVSHQPCCSPQQQLILSLLNDLFITCIAIQKQRCNEMLNI